ncbi:hypothetical protein OESDEN_00565 [Oesophagostomum dentatum]|uniref:Uncharacterized protein n=1 Tax=Oesophagostomum dentatum TaxID=61180 RepID=A0A0B1TTI4_OESDE|nr:hypothetical protein OESDEN_00565 [Oesophagostomum dentatum]
MFRGSTLVAYLKYPLLILEAEKPNTLEKIVESGSTIVEDIRCVVFCLDASENQRVTKYKKIVGALTVKGVGILFRVVLVTPSVPSNSKKLGPVRKRQQLITSLLISQWIEPPASDPSFRNSSVPLGISVEYFGNVEILTETSSVIEKWVEVALYFSCLSDSIFNISYSDFSMNSHPKFLRLNSALEKLPSPLKCLILCENEFVSRVVCEALSARRSRNAIIRVLQHHEPPIAFRKCHRLPSQCTGLFSQPREDIILILGMDVVEAANIADTACSNGLQLVVSMDRSPQRHGFELTSAEFREFCDRLAELPVVERGCYLKKHGLALLVSCLIAVVH